MNLAALCLAAASLTCASRGAHWIGALLAVVAAALFAWSL